MLSSALEKKIASVPEEHLGEIEEFVEYIIFKYSKNKGVLDVCDNSSFFGSIGKNINGLEVQRELRNEWD